MINGTTFLQHNKDWGDWKSNLVCNMIVRVSRSPFIHVQGFLNEYVYEISYPDGICKSRYPHRATIDKENGDVILEPTEELQELLTPERIKLMNEWFDKQVKDGVKYGVPKLLFFLIMGWTKPFWRWLYRKTGKEIFTNNKTYNEFCSAFWDEMYKAAGIDLFPGDSEQYTAPGDFMNCKYFVKGE